jgi:hypothetical protein
LPGAPFIGSIDHINKSAEIIATIRPQSPEHLQEILNSYSIPESLAYFIFQNRTFQNQTPNLFERRDPKTATLDTRDLSGYDNGPVFDAKFHYDPATGNNFVYLFSQPDPEVKRYFQLRIPLQNSLDLDPDQPLEALSYLDDNHKPVDIRSFRTSDPFYEHEHDPSVFIDTLQEAAKGFESFLDIRDNL